MNLKPHFLVLLLTFFCGGAFGQPVSVENPESFTFFVAGHVYGAPGVKNKPFHPPFMDIMGAIGANRKHIDFLVLTGDVVQASDEASWNSVDSAINQLEIPTIIAPGNHDLTDRELYTSRYGETNYTFEVGNNLFVVADLLNSGWAFTEQQLLNLEKTLEKKPFENIFIFNHHVIWYDEMRTPNIVPNSMYGKNDSIDFYQEQLTFFENTGSNVYLFAGDVGANPVGSELTLHQIGNVRMIASGMGGGEWDNVLIAKVKNNEVSLEVLYLNGHPSSPITNYKKVEIDEN